MFVQPAYLLPGPSTRRLEMVAFNDKGKKQAPRGPLSVRERLKAAEAKCQELLGHNIEFMNYIAVLERACKRAFMYAAEAHTELGPILLPNGNDGRKVLEEICTCLAPLCQDVEKIELPFWAQQVLLEAGGAMVKQEGDPDDHGEERSGDEQVPAG
jgi:hypothetical protein